MNRAGNAIAVWSCDGSIYGNQYQANAGWSTAALVGGGPDGYAHFPKVAVTDSGEAFVVWKDDEGAYVNRAVLPEP